ncbi:MAG TPA: cupin domain-containing protein [Candidatus Omnitrophica bacterium]|nr:cupin domain-containing protein [Candidatus Omnitrophota bacterium]
MEKKEGAKGVVIDLSGSIEYAKGAVVSKTLVDKRTGTLTLFAFDEGQGLSEHTAPYEAVVQILDGQAHLVIGGKDLIVGAGQLVIMPADIPHEIRPEKRFKMLLIMIRS